MVVRSRRRPRSSSWLGGSADRVERITAWLDGVRVEASTKVATWSRKLPGSSSASMVATPGRFGSMMARRSTWRACRDEPRRLCERAGACGARRALSAAEARLVVARAPAIGWARPWPCSSCRDGECRRSWAWRGRMSIRTGASPSSARGRLCRRHRMMLGPPKTEGAKGEHLLPPVVIELCARRRKAQDENRRRAGESWEQHVYDGRAVIWCSRRRPAGWSCVKPSRRP